MKHMIGYVTPLQVRARVGVNLDATYPKDELLNFHNQIDSFLHIEIDHYSHHTLPPPIFLTSFDRNTPLGWTASSSGVTTSDAVPKLMVAPL